MSSPDSTREFVVLSFVRPEGERFAIFRPKEWLDSASPSPWGSAATIAGAMDAFVRSLELLTEDSLRARLATLGLAGADASDHVERARRMREMHKDASWELVTVPGYRNEEGQVVVAATARTVGEPAQRVFLLQCSVCAYEYHTYGADIPHRCCPNCQDGPGSVRI